MRAIIAALVVSTLLPLLAACGPAEPVNGPGPVPIGRLNPVTGNLDGGQP